MKRGRVKMSVEDYENESISVGACLLYGTCSVARKVYQLRHGKLASSKILVCHTCDEPLCILDAHHFLGTHADNMRDMTSKGRKVAAMNKPEVLARVSAASKLAMNRPGARKRASDRSLRAFKEDPDLAVRISKGLRKYYRKPGSIEKRTELMNRPDIKKKNRDAQLIAQNRPEVRQKKSDAQRAVMMQPAMRRKNSKVQKIAQNRPDVAAKRLASVTVRWSKVSEHEKASLAQNTPRTNERRSESIRKTLALPKNSRMKHDRTVLGWATRRANALKKGKK